MAPHRAELRRVRGVWSTRAENGRHSGLLAVDPFRHDRLRLEAVEALDHGGGVALDHEQFAGLLAQEALGYGVREELVDAVVVALDAEQRARLPVEAELCPGIDLEQLLERSDPARQRDEGVGELGHRRLALVHGADYAHVGHVAVSDLAVDQRARDHARKLAARVEYRVGEHAHQADSTAAIDHADPLRREQPRQLRGGIAIGRPRAGAGPAEDADALHARQARLFGRRGALHLAGPMTAPIP